MIENIICGMSAVGLMILMVAGLSVVLAIPICVIWNLLMPNIFGLPEIGYWQALGLFCLFHLLFPSSSVSSKK